MQRSSSMILIYFLLSNIVVRPMDLATTRKLEVTKIAQKYNNHQTVCLITSIPELFGAIFNYFVDSNEPMTRSIKNILALTHTCTSFNNKFECFGSLLKSYNTQAKDEIFEKIRLYADISVRRGQLLMVCSGIVGTKYENKILSRAIDYNDTYMAELLFKNGTSPDLVSNYFEAPLFFDIETLNMATVFAHYNADFKVTSNLHPSVLWYRFESKYYDENFAEIIGFYLNKNIDPALLNVSNGKCLLHHIAKQFDIRRYETRKEPYLKGVYLILAATKNQINTLNNKGNTPLDVLFKHLTQKTLQYPEYKKDILALVSLFRIAGAHTAQELKKHSYKNRAQIA